MATSHPQPTPLGYPSALRLLLSLTDYEQMAGLTPPPDKPDMGRMKELADRLGNPQRCAPVVHIAGTKGKGSVAAMVTSIFRAAGMRAGLFTSPHLHTFTERIRLNGIPVSQESFAFHLARVWPHVEAMGVESPYGKPSTFEVLTAMAFSLFEAEEVDVQVLEVGLGGRLDSTNVADGLVAVITSLSLDHTAILGDRVGLIAGEKAGIIKPGAKVVLSPQEEEADVVVSEVCHQQGATVWRLGTEVTWKAGPADLAAQEVMVRTPSGSYTLMLPLLGPHQRENAAAAVAAVEAMEMGIGPEAIIQGIGQVEWAGRFQVLSTSPCVVVDGAHNPHSMVRLRETVKEYLGHPNTVVVFGCSADKDVEGMVGALAPLASRAVVCTSRHPRAVPVEYLKEAFAQVGVAAAAASDVSAALADAQEGAAAEDLVLVTGSLFVVAEALEAWLGIEPELYPQLEPPGSVQVGISAQVS